MYYHDLYTISEFHSSLSITVTIDRVKTIMHFNINWSKDYKTLTKLKPSSTLFGAELSFVKSDV